MSKENLKKEFTYYIENQNKLVKKYNGKFIVIKDEKVLGAFDSAIEALEETQKNHKVGSFLIQLCSPSKTSYKQTYYSRVSFS